MLCYIGAFVGLLLVTLANSQNVNPIDIPILQGNRQVHVRQFSKIPDWQGAASKIVGLIQYGRFLYVTTSTSGGLIYRINGRGKARLWFNVARAMRKIGRPMDYNNRQHGGLRGLAFHPDFKNNGLFYVSCMETRVNNFSSYRYLSRPTFTAVPADSVLIEWKADPRSMVPRKNSYRQVLRIAMPRYDHPIKQIVFKDNYLYVGHGDGSMQSAITGGGLADNALGKVLRIDPLQAGSRAYTVPLSNPFKFRREFLPEVYAAGFRNPHNLCFSARDELFVVDVGRDNVEEINIVKSGGNYGWSEREGHFVHLPRGGLVTGVGPLPKQDKKFGYIYPNAVYGHEAQIGAQEIGQAIAGSCPIENGSHLNGVMLYANFPNTGRLYYSFLDEMRNANTTGLPVRLSAARTYAARIFYDHDSDVSTRSIEMENLRDVIRQDEGLEGASRVDMRFGKGKRGVIYFSSKTNGGIYEITSSSPSGIGGPFRYPYP